MSRSASGVALLASMLLVVAGCGSNKTGEVAAPPTSSTPTGISAPAPDPSTASGAAVLALTQIYSWRPAAELPGVSLLRARRWLGPKLRAVLDNPATGVPTPKPSLQWTAWASARAIIEAFAFASGEQAPEVAPTGTSEPPGTTTVLRRELSKIGIEQTVVYPDGRREKLPPTTVIATVVLTPDGWLLDDYRPT